MMQSPTIGALAGALAKAQGQIRGAVKDAANPFFKSSYADLESVWDACRVPLSSNNLAVIQTVALEGSVAVLVTTLAHSSGEWIQGRLPLNPVKNDPQSLGSAISYARRYSLAALVGIYQTDDDGEAANGRGVVKTQTPVAPQAPVAPAQAASLGEKIMDRRKASEARGAYKFIEGKHAGERVSDLFDADLRAYRDELAGKIAAAGKTIETASPRIAAAMKAMDHEIARRDELAKKISALGDTK